MSFKQDDVSSMIFDFGSSKFSIGYNGDDSPKHTIQPFLGFNRTQDKIVYGSNEIMSSDESTKIFNLINNNGFIENFEMFENYLDHFYNSVIKPESRPLPVLFSEPALHNKEFRRKVTEVMFETFSIPGFFMTKSPVLTSFSCGKSTCLVVDSGHNVTYVTSVLEGYINQKNLIKADFGGSYLTNEIIKSLEMRGIKIREDDGMNNIDPSFDTYLKRELVNEIKEKSFVMNEIPVNNSISNNYNFKENNANSHLISSVEYKLPDGRVLDLKQEKSIFQKMFTPVKEIPGFQGIHKMAIEAIFSTDLDSRKEIYQNIIVTGGNTMFGGFNDRLQKFIYFNSPQNIRTKVVNLLSPGHKLISSWLGGSILASLGSFDQYWITGQEYNDQGGYVIETKCL